MQTRTTVKRRAAKDQLPGHTLDLSAPTTAAMIHRVEQGFPFTALLSCSKKTGLPLATIADLTQIPARTLIRRKAAARLSPDESERLLRLATLFETAVQLFEDDTD